ncbi:MAG TPA: ASCH domain-containing protein [Gemmataceae bacterium]|nr:ASCH domain-containing protein [Gemmataceae bacterium]
MPNPVAISVKQPWAALLVAGLKTIEVRRWPTRRRGRVLIHAAKLTDERPEVWARIGTAELERAAGLCGGIVGVGEITACRTYASADRFAVDTGLHLNAPDWFEPPWLFGFVFRDTRAVTFYPYTGQTMFFTVDGLTLPTVEPGVSLG